MVGGETFELVELRVESKDGNRLIDGQSFQVLQHHAVRLNLA